VYKILIFVFFCCCDTCEEKFIVSEDEFICPHEDSGGYLLLEKNCTGSQVGYLRCNPEWLCNTPDPITSGCYYCASIDKVEAWIDNNCKSSCRVEMDTLSVSAPDHVITLTCDY
jgi:hypothetical protein